MKQYMRRNEKQMEREREMAKQLIKANKKESALATALFYAFCAVSVNELEFSEIVQRVVEELRRGNETLKQMNKMFSIEDIEKIMDETKEAAEFQEEISSMLSGKLSEDDMEEVENEFAKLMEEESKLVLPEVPSDVLPERIPEKTSKFHPRQSFASFQI
ncbi:unnamed protein product [Gongylonema pulchrum]|uniref:Charged multivesicular body protein 6 n=1 Tax=Gongylonema pulchrum TaxID=637853 RepID=A0A183E159_9BILA|nr:unnamed protein product [Gongylonema pulchrum]